MSIEASRFAVIKCPPLDRDEPRQETEVPAEKGDLEHIFNLLADAEARRQKWMRRCMTPAPSTLDD